MSYTIFDADNHMYETQDALTRYLPAEHKNLFRLADFDGRKKLVVRGVVSDAIPNPTFSVIARPGSHEDFYLGKAAGRTIKEVTGEPMRIIPEFQNARDRLPLLDQQGVQATLMYPTLASLIEERLIDSPELTQVAIRAFNEWLADEWPYAYQDRIFTTPMVNPCILDEGIAELERVLDRGAQVVLLRPAPLAQVRGTKSPFLPEFDPFWARIQDAGIPVVLHAADDGMSNLLNRWEGVDGQFLAFDFRPFRSVADAGRSIHDALASAVCHGMLTRFPGVKLVSVENGGSWVSVLLNNLEQAYKKMPTAFAEHPLEVFRRQVWVNPFWEDSLERMIDLLGPERVCFGSDYPHPEGLAEPASFVNEIGHLAAPDIERIMGANLYELVPAARPAA